MNYKIVDSTTEAVPEKQAVVYPAINERLKSIGCTHVTGVSITMNPDGTFFIEGRK